MVLFGVNISSASPADAGVGTCLSCYFRHLLEARLIAALTPSKTYGVVGIIEQNELHM